MAVVVSPMSPSDYPDIARILRQGIATGNATFETDAPPTWEAWSRGKLSVCRLVAREDDEVVGWAALSPVSSRAVYAGVAELSIYVDEHARGRGVGSLLMDELVRQSEAAGIWTLQTGIFPENTASLHLHARHGFRQVGVRERIGRMTYGARMGEWRDVLFLERRSRTTGV